MTHTRPGSGLAKAPEFNARVCLDVLRSTGVAEAIVPCARSQVLFTQGDVGEQVLYLESGGVKLSVLSKTGREAIVALLGPGDFFGQACLAGQRLRRETATAMTPSVVLIVPKERLIRLLRQDHAMSDRFIAHLLARNIRIEEDLVDQLCNSSERRLARALLRLAPYGKPGTSRVVPRMSQETLADLIGTTRSRVNFFLNKFKKLGFIEYDGARPLTINTSRLRGVLQTEPSASS